MNGEDKTTSDGNCGVLQQILGTVLDLALVSPSDLLLTAAAIEETLLRIRSEPQLDLIWEDDGRP